MLTPARLSGDLPMLSDAVSQRCEKRCWGCSCAMLGSSDDLLILRLSRHPLESITKTPHFVEALPENKGMITSDSHLIGSDIDIESCLYTFSWLLVACRWNQFSVTERDSKPFFSDGIRSYHEIVPWVSKSSVFNFLMNYASDFYFFFGKVSVFTSQVIFCKKTNKARI